MENHRHRQQQQRINAGRRRGQQRFSKPAGLATFVLWVLALGADPCRGASRRRSDSTVNATAMALAAIAQKEETAAAKKKKMKKKASATAEKVAAPIAVPPIPSRRTDRFPSVEHRVKLYMSNWYAPPCPDDPSSFIGYQLNYTDTESVPSGDRAKARKWPTVTLHGYNEDHPLFNETARVIRPVSSVIEPDTLFFVNRTIVVSCANFTDDKTSDEDPHLKRVNFRKNMRMYCEDVVTLLFPAWSSRRLYDPPGTTRVPPTLMQFGDNKQSHVFKDVNVPHIKKFRSAAASPSDLEIVTPEGCQSGGGGGAATRTPLVSAHGNRRLQPIVWKLATDRHFRKLRDVYRYDRPWHHKQNKAIFKGALTGSRDGYDKAMTPMENCRNMRRCRLVYDNAGSNLVDATLTRLKDRLPEVLNGVTLYGNKTNIDDLLSNKAIIMIEGNDVASGLKWALLSQSVVLMAPPKHTSWAMEELLEPWVHYVPLDEFATDAEERMQWIIDHDDEAQRIAERSTLWMEDMVFHPDAMEDDRRIQNEILRRYEAQFRHLDETDAESGTASITSDTA